MSASAAPGRTTPRSSGATTIESAPASRLGFLVMGTCTPSPASTSRRRDAEPVPSVAMTTRFPLSRSDRIRPASASTSPTTGSNAAAASWGVSGESGEASRLVARAFVWARSRSNGNDSLGKSWPSAPQVPESVSARFASSSRSS